MSLMPPTVEVTDDHVKLLRRLHFAWNDAAYDGAPTVNLKRPYGNSAVFEDVAETLGWEFDPEFGLPDELEARCRAIHEEMAVVLQVLVHNPLAFGPGTYVNVDSFAPYGVTYARQEA